MVRISGKIVCWLLTLSLLGLPYTVLSAQSMTPPDAHTCYEMSADSHSNIASAHSVTKQFCDESCLCADMTDCQSSAQQQFSAIPFIRSILRFGGLVQLILEHSHIYHDRIISPDIKPPIV